MGLAEDVFGRLRRILFEGEYRERMAALGTSTQLSPGVIKVLTRLAEGDGVSMGEMARGLGCDPSYVTALVDDLTTHGLATRESSPTDRRVKTVCLTAKGRTMAEDIASVLSVPPASFGALSRAELLVLRDLLEKLEAAEQERTADAPSAPTPTRAVRAAS
ncbi:MAG TPA: MarR family winged helix-turn-helix transcriptional regulator [Acidimicrobiales bacterium]|nr:MarR family winged helix-turn-helix transcriptional regulator [Acidimicrobiales bacterium]